MRSIGYILKRIWLRFGLPLLLIFIVLNPVFCGRNYGTEYNEERRKLEIPPVGDAWKRQKSISNEIDFTNPSVTSKRYHLKKIIRTNFWGKITEESDLYILEDCGMTIDVTYKYNLGKHWMIRCYFTSKNKMQLLSRREFGDTLKKYKVNL